MTRARARWAGVTSVGLVGGAVGVGGLLGAAAGAVFGLFVGSLSLAEWGSLPLLARPKWARQMALASSPAALAALGGQPRGVEPFRRRVTCLIRASPYINIRSGI